MKRFDTPPRSLKIYSRGVRWKIGWAPALCTMQTVQLQHCGFVVLGCVVFCTGRVAKLAVKVVISLSGFSCRSAAKETGLGGELGSFVAQESTQQQHFFFFPCQYFNSLYCGCTCHSCGAAWDFEAAKKVALSGNAWKFSAEDQERQLQQQQQLMPVWWFSGDQARIHGATAQDVYGGRTCFPAAL